MGFKSIMKKIGKVALKTAPIWMSVVPGIGPAAGIALSGAASAADKKLSGGSWKSSLLAGGIGAGSAGFGAAAKAGKLGKAGKILGGGGKSAAAPATSGSKLLGSAASEGASDILPTAIPKMGWTLGEEGVGDIAGALAGGAAESSFGAAPSAAPSFSDALSDTAKIGTAKGPFAVGAPPINTGGGVTPPPGSGGGGSIPPAKDGIASSLLKNPATYMAALSAFKDPNTDNRRAFKGVDIDAAARDALASIRGDVTAHDARMKDVSNYNTAANYGQSRVPVPVRMGEVQIGGGMATNTPEDEELARRLKLQAPRG